MSAGSYTARLTEEDRHHGRVALSLITDWPDWVKRRVEWIELINTSTFVRHVSVDFRIRSWLPDPILAWADGPGVHYLPMALLEKQPLTAFDVRDESGIALPLLTRRKNAAIAAGALIAAAQFSIFEQIKRATLAGTRSPNPLPPGVHVPSIALPDELEDDFRNLGYLPFETPERGDGRTARQLVESFYTQPASLSQPATWEWEFRNDCWHAKSVDPAMWRWYLINDPGFEEVALDLARLFMVTVPIDAEEKRRRIVKLTYQSHLAEPQVAAVYQMKRFGNWLHAERWMTRFEDWIEGLPRAASEEGDEWAETPAIGVIEQRVKLRHKFIRAIGWGTTSFTFDVPAVGEGGSFHFELQAPEGLQIRRASLSARVGDRTVRKAVQRGARNLERVHLYVGAAPRAALGVAKVSLKPRVPTVIRASTLAAVLIAAGLTIAGVAYLDELRDTREIGPAAAILLIVPGLLAAHSTRASEHPLTNSLLFGVRLLTLVSGACAVTAAAVLVAFRHDDDFCLAWWVLTGIALAVAVFLVGAWRFAARRRPHGTNP